MEGQPNDANGASQPDNRSLEAYKAWVMEIAQRLMKADTQIKLTEEEWIASWNEYWLEKSQ